MSQPESSRAQRALVLIGIVVLAFNLRPAAVSVGPLLDEITNGLGMSGTQAALLTSLPVLCFASVGGVAPRLGKALGLHRSIMLGLIAMTVGLYARAHVDGVWTFLALSFLALAGMAASNVLLPSLVKLHFPDRIGQVTGLYSTALAIGITATSTLSVPIAEHHRVHGEIDWRRGLVAWAITAAIAAVPWVGLLAHDQR
ncbi:MAG: MFS transporter, partial [Candidatus Limnocylindrales bacterium]